MKEKILNFIIFLHFKKCWHNSKTFEVLPYRNDSYALSKYSLQWQL